MIVIRKCQKPFQVLPLQSLVSSSREQGRVLGRRVQPSENKQERNFSGFQNPEGSRKRTVTRCFNNF